MVKPYWNSNGYYNAPLLHSSRIISFQLHPIHIDPLHSFEFLNHILPFLSVEKTINPDQTESKLVLLCLFFIN
jgi:hypothetical protein